MSSPESNFRRWFRGSGEGTKPSATAKAAPRTSRRCIGLGEFLRGLSGAQERLSVLDLGPTSPANISFLTEMEARVYNEDVLRATRDPSYMARQEDGTEQLDSQKFFAENCNYAEGTFDAILFWDLADYLPEALVKPLVERIQVILKPKGILLALFHTKDAGPESPYYRYHIAGRDVLELEQGPNFRLQRIFNNRHVENLFKEFSSRKFFLGRDNIREVIVVR